MNLSNTICFTMTVCMRPEILEQCLGTFDNFINGGLSRYDVIANIDPAPSRDNKKKEKTISILKHYFASVKYRHPDSPNFASAVKWIWASARTPYIFHLEDDWILRREIDIPDILRKFKRKSELIQVKFRKFRKWHRNFPDYYSLSPSIISRKLFNIASLNMRIDKNPERQLRFYNKMKIPRPKYGKTIMVLPDINSSWDRMVRDIGKGWSKDENIKKSGNAKENKFLRWEKK
jgi:hypothetical protein